MVVIKLYGVLTLTSSQIQTAVVYMSQFSFLFLICIDNIFTLYLEELTKYFIEENQVAPDSDYDEYMDSVIFIEHVIFMLNIFLN